VSVSNSYIVNPGNAIVTVNKNWGDEATLKNVWVKSSKASVKICQWSQGNANGEPKMLGNGPSPPLCQYSESDVHINKDVSQAAQTSPSSTSSSSDVTQTASSASTASSDVTQTASSVSTDSSVASSASTASSSSQNPTQASSSSTTSSASASYQASSNSSTDASEADAPGTVAPVENGSFEQSVVSSDASQTQQQDSTEEPTATPSVSSSGSGSLYSSSDGVSQTAVQQSSVSSSSATDLPYNNVVLDCGSTSSNNAEQNAPGSQPTSVDSSSATDLPYNNVVLDCGSSSGNNAKQSSSASQPTSVDSSSATDLPYNNVVLDCGSSSGNNAEQSGVTSQPSSSSNADDVTQTDVASSNADDTPMTNVVLDCGSSSGSSTEQVEVPSQQSTSASASAGSTGPVQEDNELTFAPSASSSSTSRTSTASSLSSASTSGPIEQGSSTVTQSSGSDSVTQTATNGSVPDGTWPASTGVVLYSKPYTIKAGEVFDGKMQTFERSDITCSGGEGQKDTAVFLVEAGGTLKNAIIGKNQKEGVHCDDHDCTIENVWWDDVCEDALSIKGGTASSVTTVTNCGARYASDKVVQHNGYGTVKINGFFAQEFGKLYRSCGTCGDIPRTVTVDNVYAIDPLVSVVTVNKNYGDQATLSNIHVKTTNGNNDVKVCQWSQGGSSPSNLGDGPSGTLCQYSDSDIHINEE
ncbi:hypothetical protein JG688_00012664, partial [Phytophthora aleatoria]